MFEPKLDNLPLTTVFTLNACFFDLLDDRLVEHQTVSDITKKIIAFNCVGYLDTFPEYQAFRAMDLANRLGYRLHAQVDAFVRSRIAQSTEEEFFKAVLKHRPDITKEEIGTLRKQYSGDMSSGR